MFLAKNIRGMVWICDTHNLTSEATTVTGNDDHPGFGLFIIIINTRAHKCLL